MRYKRAKKRLNRYALLCSCTLFGAAARADQVNYTGAAVGNWTTAANWTDTTNSTNKVPATGDAVLINNTDGISRSVTYDYAGPLVSLKSFELDGGTGGSTNTFMMSANVLNTVNGNPDMSVESVGKGGYFLQSGGANTTETLGLGSNDAAHPATYTISGNATLDAPIINLGPNSTINQLGGTVTTSLLSTGGTYNFNAGNFNSTLVFAFGPLNLNGGVFTPQAIQVYSAGAVGAVHLSGATVQTDRLDISPANSGSAPAEFDMSGGILMGLPQPGPSLIPLTEFVRNGIFNQSGGSNLAMGGLSMANLDPGTVNPAVYNFSGGTLTLSGLALGFIQPNDVTPEVPGPAIFTISGTAHLTTGGLVISSQAKMDMTGGTVSEAYGTYPTPNPYIRSLLIIGYNQGAWNGLGGIASSAAIDHGGLVYGVGYADSADNANVIGLNLPTKTELVSFALCGDMNLDGKVDFTDLTMFEANYGKSLAAWDAGDFNYDGLVSGADLQCLARNYGRTVDGGFVPMSAADQQAIFTFAQSVGVPITVPEPAAVGALMLVGAGLLLRRRTAS